MHITNNFWLDELKEEYWQSFTHRSVLELGSLDINGSPRPWFENCQYVGVDRTEGKGVDLVCNFKETKFDNHFDVIISLNALMYDRNWRESLAYNLQWLRKGGMLFVTFADLRWEGSRRKYPDNEIGEMIRIDNHEFRTICIDGGINILEYFYEQHRWPKETMGGVGTFNIVGQKL